MSEPVAARAERLARRGRRPARCTVGRTVVEGREARAGEPVEGGDGDR